MIQLLQQIKHRYRFPVRLTALLSAAVLAFSQPLPVSAAETDTPLPAVYIQTGSTIGDNYQDAVVSVRDENGTDDITDAACSVRLRGNSSRRTPKPSYKLHFPDKANPLQLGDGKAKTWALISNSMDPSLLRNFTAMHFAEKLSGLPYTPNCRSVDVYQNGEYRGVYLLIETVSVNKHRIAITEERDKIEDNGYLLEMTRYADQPAFFADTLLFEVKSELSADPDTQDAQLRYIAQYTEEALHALQSGDAGKAAQYINIDSLVDNCLLNEICKNVDVGWDSYYLYKDAGGKLTFCPIWDFDIAFGATAYPLLSSAEGENPFALSDCLDDSNGWLCYAMRSAWFRKLLKARWEEMLPEIRAIPAAVTEEAAAHTSAYEKNYTLPTTNSIVFTPYPDDSSKPCNTQAAQAEILSLWIGKRIAWLDEYYHSPEFDAGIFPDASGNAMQLQNELLMHVFGDLPFDHKDLSGLNYSASVYNDTSMVSIDWLKLIAGQTYKLSFDYSCTDSADISCLISDNNSGDALLSENVTADAETKTAELLFTPKSGCADGSLRIRASGRGTLKISDLSLEKQFAAPVSGDLNSDGQCDGEDVRLLLDLLLCKPDAALTDPQAADVNADGVLNGKDLTLLKQTALSA